MDVSQGYRFLWIVGAAFVLLPQLNVGLLSDLKICGDSECESMMSRVQAIRDHHGKDCRFLNFRRGDTIFVYHKLTGRREDLWAGTIDKQFGYFPKDAVKEEQVYATTEKVVETQKSDFFCVDESGYFIDSTHLDTDDDSDLKIQIQESETTQITPNTHDTTPDGSVEASTGSSIAAQEAEGGENKNAGDAAGLNEEAHATPATVDEQGGSPSSSPSWLGSSAIGWLGLSKEEQPDNLAEREGGDERKETKADESLTSSVTGWLGFGGKGEPDDAKESVNIEETSDSFASTLTGLFSFGGEKKNDAEKNEQDKERETDEEKEPTETFRSRRMSLDLEGSQLHEEEKKETGTFGWLTNGLSDRLGFGSTNQDPGHEASGGEGEEAKEQSVYSSWVDMGIGGYFGYGKDNAEVDEGKRNEKEKDVTLEQLAESVIANSSQSQATATEEVKTEFSNESQVEKPAKDQNVSSPETVSGDGNDDNVDDNKDAARRESSVSGVEAGLKVDHKDISANTKLEETSQPEGRMSSMFNNFFQTGDARDENLEDEVKIEEARSVQTEDENHLMPNSMGNTREPGEEEINTTSDNRDFITPEPDHSFDEQWLNSSGQPVGKDEKDETDRNRDTVEEEVIKITSEVDNSAETTDVLVKDQKEDQKGEETDLPHEEVLRNQTEDSAEENEVSGETEEISGQSQLFLSSSEKKNELIPAEDSFTPPTTEANDKNSDTVTVADDDAEAGTPRGELWQEEETQGVDESSQESVSESAESPHGNASEEDRGTISGEATLNINQASVSPGTEYSERDIRDADEQKETVKDQQEQTEKTSGFEEDFSSDSDLKHTEAEDGKEEDFMKGEKKEAMEVKGNEIVEDLKEEKLIEVGEVKEETQGEEHQKEKEEIKEEEKQENNQELEVEEEKKVEDSKEEEIEEFKWEKKGEEVMELKGEEEANKAKEEQQQEVDELNVEEIIEQETQVRVDGSKELEELSEHEKINEGRQMQEVQVEIIQSDFSRPALESNKKVTPDDISSVSWFTETEIPQVEEEKGEEKDDEQKEGQEVIDGKMEGEEVVENQQTSHVAYDSLKCLNEHCSQDGDEGAVIEGDGGASEDGASSGGEGATWTGGQNDPAEQTGERQAIDSDEETSNNVVKGNDDSEVQTRKTNGETIGSESHSGGGELPLPPDDPNESEVVTSEQTTSHSPEHLTGSTRLPGASESEIGGAFGVFKNAFGIFSQTPTTESQGSTQSTQNFNINSGETSQPQTSLTPEQELDSTTDSHHPQEAYTASPTEQPHTPAAGTVLHTATSIPEAPHQTKALIKHYKNLLVHINVDETAILMELLGRHKLQFLDYVLVSSEAMTENQEEDRSILLDIERLLDHHRETLVAPSLRLTDAPQEDKKRITMLNALQKLEMLLKTVKNTFNTGMSDVSYHQAEPRCASASCSTQDSSIDQDNNIHRDEQMTVENNQMGGGKLKESNSVDEERRDEGSEEEGASGPHTQPGSSQPPEGVIKQSLDFVLRVVEDVTIHSLAVRAFLIWLTVQVRAESGF